MGQKIVVGPIGKGLRNDVTPFNIDKDSFPTLINAYQWRGRVKRKRGTSYLNRLQRLFYNQSIGVSGASPWSYNLFSSVTPAITPETNASIVPGSVRVLFSPATLTGSLVSLGYTIASDAEVFTTSTAGLETGDEITISGVVVVPGTGPATINGGPYTIEVLSNGTSFKLGVDSHGWGRWQSGGTWSKATSAVLTLQDQGNGRLEADPVSLTNFGTINYSTGDVVITDTLGPGLAVSASFSYYPTLPVMGLREFENPNDEFPETLAFDTKYSYYILSNNPYTPKEVNYYKNPPLNAEMPGYTQKTADTHFVWNGEDYQQFWTVNYQGALWATNGIRVPFVFERIGMQYGVITNAVVVGPGTPPAVVTLTIANHGLEVGDFVYINEIVGLIGINFQTGYVTAVVPNVSITVEFPKATITGAYASGGIAQYLTNQSDPTQDNIKWYDGDPTNGDKGWVNFMPPLSEQPFSISGLRPAIWYLVGARMILPYKDRLLFIGPVVQTSEANSQVYLQDTVVFSQNGTPYYTVSYTNDPNPNEDFPTSITNDFFPMLLPDNQTSTAPAWFADSAGFGGWISAGVSEPITTAAANGDVIIMGFDPSIQSKFVYTGNDDLPFNFYLVNSELGSESTFSSINFDKGVITKGPRGFVITSETQTKRIDLEIPDEVFSMNILDNGIQRMTSQRDFINEWIYFTYPYSQFSDPSLRSNKFPNRTLQYNYRDNSWAIFNESATTYGSFRRRTGYTWFTIGNIFSSWEVWNEPWNAGSTTILQPEVILGNQQGFILFRDDGTNESESLAIRTISFPTAITGVTQANPAVITASGNFVSGQSVTISGVVGMTELNGNTYTVVTSTPTTVTINVSSIPFTPYVSGGTITPEAAIYSPDHGLNEGDFIIISDTVGTIDAQVNQKIFSVAPTITNDSFDLDPPITSGTYTGSGLIKRMYVPQIQTMQFPVAWDMARKTRIGAQQYLLSTTDDAQITLQIFLSQNSSSAYNTGPIYPNVNATNDSLVYTTVLYTCPESSNLGLTPANTNLQMVTALQQEQIWHRVHTSSLGESVQRRFTVSDEQKRSMTPTGSVGTITGATQANPVVLTTTAQTPVNTLVRITGIRGMIELNYTTLGNNIYRVIASDETTVTLDVDSTAFTAYLSGGTIVAVSPNNQFAEIELHGMILDVNPSMMLA